MSPRQEKNAVYPNLHLDAGSEDGKCEQATMFISTRTNDLFPVVQKLWNECTQMFTIFPAVLCNSNRSSLLSRKKEAAA